MEDDFIKTFRLFIDICFFIFFIEELRIC